MIRMEFEWDDSKATLNRIKYGLSFDEAQQAFFDPQRLILIDSKHSFSEERYFCLGRTETGKVATVRFTIRSGRIRLIGAGYWREGKTLYDQQT